EAGEIEVMMSGAFKEAYVELVPQFERTSEHTVSTIQIPSVDMMARLKGGETVDLVIMAGDAIDALMADGKIVRGSRTDLARSGVGVAGGARAPQPPNRPGRGAGGGPAGGHPRRLPPRAPRALPPPPACPPGPCPRAR